MKSKKELLCQQMPSFKYIYLRTYMVCIQLSTHAYRTVVDAFSAKSALMQETFLHRKLKKKNSKKSFNENYKNYNNKKKKNAEDVINSSTHPSFPHL